MLCYTGGLGDGLELLGAGLLAHLPLGVGLAALVLRGRGPAGFSCRHR